MQIVQQCVYLCASSFPRFRVCMGLLAPLPFAPASARCSRPPNLQHKEQALHADRSGMCLHVSSTVCMGLLLAPLPFASASERCTRPPNLQHKEQALHADASAMCLHVRQFVSPSGV
jgi:hypothetical protein